MNMNKSIMKICLLCLAFFHSLAISGQQPTLQPVAPSIPTSPQAEAFQRYGDLAINHSTGTPDISIPLFEISHRGYKLPLTLKYNPQPLRPGYNYDVYGHGWGLSIGSCVSRTIEYMPDEWRNFKIETDKLPSLFKNYASNVMNFNLGHDIFTAVLPDGSSFEFVIKNQYGKIEYVVSDGRQVKINCSHTQSNINSFTITDEQGIKYSFTGADRPYRNNIGVTPYSNSYVSWQLTGIQLPNSSEPINFEYSRYIESDYTRFMQEATVMLSHKLRNNPPKGFANAVFNANPYFYRMQLLTRISYGSTRISLNYAKQGNGETYNYVNSIEVEDNGSPVREIGFDRQVYSFSYTGNSSDSIAKLTGVTISGTSGDPMKYSCTYWSNGGNFAGTDHWGYLNNHAGNNDVALMNTYVGFLYNDLIPVNVAIAQQTKAANDPCPYTKIRLSAHSYDNRAPLPPSSHGVLKTLVYPTGGYTQFEFENHRCLTRTAANGDYIHDANALREIAAGGCRIKKITNYTAAGTVAGIKTYAYGAGGTDHKHTGLGESVADPNILTYINFTTDAPFPLRYMFVGLSTTGQQGTFLNPFLDNFYMDGLWGWECAFSVNNFRSLLNGRSAVVYPEVTEYHGDIYASGIAYPERTTGKSVYKYDIRDILASDTSFFEKAEYYGNNLSYTPKKFRYNILTEKTDYVYESSGYRPIRTETYNWQQYYEYVFNYQYTNAHHPDEAPNSATLNEFFKPKRYYLGGKMLTSRRVVQEDPSYGVVQSETFSYNPRKQLISQTVSGSAGQSVCTTYSYPDTVVNKSPVIKAMVEKNIISPVLEQRTQSNMYSSGSAYLDVSGDSLEYAAHTAGNATFYFPKRAYMLDAKTSNTNSDYVLNTEVLSFSANGNPREVVTADGMHTFYLWSYNDRYPIAEIRNATSAQVSAAVSAVFGTTVDALAQAASPDATQVEALRNNSNLSGAFVTTYTYKPLVGVTSMTEPNGRTTYYRYDGMGRLLDVFYYEDTGSSMEQRILQQYEYQYHNQ